MRSRCRVGQFFCSNKLKAVKNETLKVTLLCMSYDGQIDRLTQKYRRVCQREKVFFRHRLPPGSEQQNFFIPFRIEFATGKNY